MGFLNRSNRGQRRMTPDLPRAAPPAAREEQPAPSSDQRTGTPPPGRGNEAHLEPRNDTDAMVDEMWRTLKQADAGDPVAELRTAALGCQLRGEAARAYELFTRAARLGDIPSMYDAGCEALEQGNRTDAIHWFESAGELGHAAAMYNRAALDAEQDPATAARWFGRAADAGDADACAAMTEIATRAGDDAAERRWSHLGAEREQPFCLVRYGQLLASAANGDRGQVRAARGYFERAARLDVAEGAFLAGISSFQLEEHSVARDWLQRAERGGHPRAAEALQHFELS